MNKLHFTGPCTIKAEAGTLEKGTIVMQPCAMAMARHDPDMRTPVALRLPSMHNSG